MSSGIDNSQSFDKESLSITGLRSDDKILKKDPLDYSDTCLVQRENSIFVIKKDIILTPSSFSNRVKIQFEDPDIINSISINDIKISEKFDSIFFNENCTLKTEYPDGNINLYKLFEDCDLTISKTSAKTLTDSLDNQLDSPEIPSYFFDYEMYMISLQQKTLDEDNITDLTSRIINIRKKKSEHGISWDEDFFNTREDFFKEPTHYISE